MISTTRKRGRKPKSYITTWGETIPGLARRPADGRWRIVATGYTFTESDERLAVARFRSMQGVQTVDVPISFVANPPSSPAMEIVDLTSPEVRKYLPIPVIPEIVIGQSVVQADTFWSWLRELLLTRPQYVAQQVGIEQIGYLDEIAKPSSSSKLADIGQLYSAKSGLSANEVSRSKLFWRQFCRAVEVESVRELTHENVTAYEGKIQAGGYAPKSMLHRYRKIRTIFAHAIKRGVGIEDCRRALDITAMLEVKDHTPLDPKPISPRDFWAIYKAAVKADDMTFAALMLTALNCAMYAGEISDLKWNEVDLKTGGLVTRRPKTGVSRVAMLWPETVMALKALPQTGEHIFNTRARSYTVYSVLAAWRKYREAAGLGADVVFGMIRDAAFTIACRSSTLDQARVLAGHRLPGASDHYIRRNPTFVSDACTAIRTEFYRAKPGRKPTVRHLKTTTAK